MTQTVPENTPPAVADSTRTAGTQEPDEQVLKFLALGKQGKDTSTSGLQATHPDPPQE